RDAEARLAAVVERLRAAVGEHRYGEDAADLAAVVLDALRSGRHRLGVAESCTGGMLAERVTNIPGASATFIGGVVAYADVVKTAALKVRSRRWRRTAPSRSRRCAPWPRGRNACSRRIAPWPSPASQDRAAARRTSPWARCGSPPGSTPPLAP